MSNPQSLLFLANFLRILSHGQIGMRPAKKLYSYGFDTVRKLVHAKDYEVRSIVGGTTAERTIELIKSLREGYSEPFHLMSASGVFGNRSPNTLENIYNHIEAADRYSFLCANILNDTQVLALAGMLGRNMAGFILRFNDFMEFLAQNHVVIDTRYLK